MAERVAQRNTAQPPWEAGATTAPPCEVAGTWVWPAAPEEVVVPAEVVPAEVVVFAGVVFAGVVVVFAGVVVAGVVVVGVVVVLASQGG